MADFSQVLRSASALRDMCFCVTCKLAVEAFTNPGFVAQQQPAVQDRIQRPCTGTADFELKVSPTGPRHYHSAVPQCWVDNIAGMC